MCGIVGYFDPNSYMSSDRNEQLELARTALIHRGPDDGGTWIDEHGTGLAQTRLSILDLSDLGHQPMLSVDGRYALVFNGEVYNFREIRTELESMGQVFTSSGDTEVVLSAFAQWGVDCAQRFIGMFALAVWDKHTLTLTLLRDRVGVKPLYYSWNGEVMCFASELRALLKFSHWTPRVDRQAVGEFLQYGTIAAPRSIFQDVYKLRPGHHLVISSAGEGPTISPYWSLIEHLQESSVRNEEELTNELESLLMDALQYRMIADVPVGVFLSGGIDSSIVAAMLQASSDTPINTFTIAFEDSDSDESRWARRVSEHLGTHHTEYQLNLDEAQQLAKKFSSYYDEPFGDSSAIPTCCVAELSGDAVKVVLSSDGGDELFCGYTSYTHVAKRLARFSRWPIWLRRLLRFSLATMHPATLSQGFAFLGLYSFSRFLDRLARFEACWRDDTLRSLAILAQCNWTPAEVSALIGCDYEDPRVRPDSFPGTPVEQLALWDFHYYLPDDILVKVDRATMRSSIEGREPLLDHRLVEFAFNLPMQLRIGSLGQKHILRKILYKYVPAELIDRPKQGFSIPIEKWMPNMNAIIDQLTNQESLLGNYVSPAAIHREIKTLQRSGGNATRIWHLYVLDQWLREYDTSI